MVQLMWTGRGSIRPAAIELVHAAGGAVVAAHPPFLGEDYGRVIDEVAPMGLDGLEVYYKHYDEETVARLECLAHRHGLAMSGGSDFHGLGNPNDRAIGDIPFSDAAVDAFLTLLKRNSANERITAP